jgi:hypothetical protein
MANDKTHGFVFYANSPPFDEQQDFVAHIPKSIGDVKTLLDVLFEKLELPGYFGFNWDALSECLEDLSWLKQYRVVILHHDLPKLPKADLSIYLNILQECTRSWKPGEDHQLIVAFPKDCETEVLDILNDHN